MLGLLTDLLGKTFTGGTDVGEVVSQLNSLITEESFLESFHQIILTSEDNLKKAAISYLNNGVLNLWPELAPEFKGQFLQLFVELLCSCDFSIHPALKHAVKRIIQKVYFIGEWEGFEETVLTLAQSEEGNSQRAALSLVCGTLSLPNNVPQEFMDKIIEYLSSSVISSDDPLLLQLSLQALSRATKRNGVSLNEMLPSIVESFAQKQIFESGNEDLINSALKFLCCFTSEVIVCTYNVVLGLLEKELSVRQSCLFIHLLTNIVKYQEGYELFAEVYPTFIHDFALPVFSLSEESISLATEAANEFVSDVHKLGSFETTQLAVSTLIYTISTTFPQTTEIPFQVIQEVLGQEATPGIIFGALHLLTSCSSTFAKANEEAFCSFVDGISSLLFECEDEVARAASFMFIANTTKYKLPLEKFEQIIPHLNDPSRLVQYYAAVCLSNSMTQRDDVTAEDILTVLQIPMDELFSFFISLSTEFSHFDLAESIFQLIEFQGASIAEFAGPLSTELITLISQTDDPSVTLLTFNAIEEIFTIMAKSAETSEALPPIFENALQISQDIVQNELQKEEVSGGEAADSSAFETASSLFKTLSICVLLSATFNEKYLEYIEPLAQFLDVPNPDLLEGLMFLIGSIIFRDDSFMEREYAGQLIEKIVELTNEETFTTNACALAAIAFRNDEIIESLIPLLIEGIEEIDQDSAVLLNVLLMKAPQQVLEAARESLDSVIETFIGNFSYPNSVLAGITLQSILGELPEQRMEVLTCIISHSQSFLVNDEDFEDDFEENDLSYPISSKEDSLKEVWELIQKLSTEEIFEAVNSENESTIEMFKEKFGANQ